MGPRGANRNYTYKLTKGKELMIEGGEWGGELTI
jgi:hypothetical protein